MSIRLLKTLIAVSEHKTFGAAADHIFITHAAVSQQMKTLEENLQVKIFDRSSRTPELTHLGIQLVEKAKLLITDYENLVPSIIGDDIFNGELRLGVVPTSLTSLTPIAISHLRKLHTNLRIKIVPNTTNNLVLDLSRNNLDAAVLSFTSLFPADLSFRPIADESLQLITSLQNDQIDPIDILSNNPYIRFNREAVVGSMIEHWLLLNSVNVNEVMELHSLEAISSMVSADLGVSIIPQPCISSQYKIPLRTISLEKYVTDGMELKRKLGIAYKSTNPKLRAIEKIYECLLTAVPDREDFM